MLPDHPLKAVLWDFDGTMADTRRRNLSVNRRIVEEIAGTPWREIAGLSSVEAYDAAWSRVRNWQELYTTSFGLTDEQCRRAVQRWAPYQLADRTEVPLFDGVEAALDRLGHLPQAVVSQNDRAIIEQVLKDTGVNRYFSAIVGYAEVPLSRQKPAPDGLLRALDILGLEEPATVLYVGDHEADAHCAANANRDLVAIGHEIWFRFVAAHFVDGGAGNAWSIRPDYRVDGPHELAELVETLSEPPSDG
ncbi:MAG: HAD family hydrolase [Holophagae bacterium]|jgi:HAD superfamily hydrolase (TIGR01549 family)